MNNLQVKLGKLTLSNPVMTASGTCGYGMEMARFYPLDTLGAICLKGTTLHARSGNAQPRIAECPSGLLNSVGLENIGVDKLIEQKIPPLRAMYKGVIVANVAGFSLDEYQMICAQLDKCQAIDAIEVNISCPNVHGGGMAFGISANDAGQVCRRVRRATTKPIYIKLSPNTADIVGIARVCEEEGADALTLINTISGLRLNMATKKPLLANVVGGLSGPCILPVALRAVYQVYQAVAIPIIGVGGVSTALDVCEMMLCGATAVQVGSASLVNPYVCKEIIDQLPESMHRLHVKKINQLIGGAHENAR